MTTDEDVTDRMPLIEDFRTDLANKVAEARIQVIAAASSAFGSEMSQVGISQDDLGMLVDRFAEDLNHAFDDFREEYALLQDELLAINTRAAYQGASQEDEIRRRAIQGRLDDMREGRGDFYPYRYLGGRGFLPNYAFPRRASNAYFTDRKESISRRPSLALREFAPLNTIYYRRHRYRVVKAQPRARGEAHHWSRLKVCECGNFFLNEQIAQSAACDVCGTDLTASHAKDRVLGLPDAVARRAGRISADEEERQRRGFNIKPYYRPGPRTRSGNLSMGEEGLAAVTYAHHGELLLVNHGARASEEQGFRFCDRCRSWIGSESGEQEHVDEEGRNRCPAGGTEDDLHREVLLYAQGRHDFVTVNVPVPAGTERESFGWSLTTALLCGFQIAFSADESEVSGHLFAIPNSSDRCRILLNEGDEGGQGLIVNLCEVAAWQRVARRALEILHVEPDTDEELPRACDRACYDCLLSYYNQQYHQHLDRRLVIDTLRRFARADDLSLHEPGRGVAWAQFKERAIGAEPLVIEELERRGFPLPIGQHEVVRNAEGIPIAEADLLYPGRIVVWVHGDPHRGEHVARRDVDLERRLCALGYRVVTIWYDRVADGLRDLASRLGRPDLEGS
jgi:hypothetical protein